jgi:hypothetical protein
MSPQDDGWRATWEHFDAAPIDGVGPRIRITRTWTTKSYQDSDRLEPPSTRAGRSHYTVSDAAVEDLGGNRFKVAGKAYKRTR